MIQIQKFKLHMFKMRGYLLWTILLLKIARFLFLRIKLTMINDLLVIGLLSKSIRNFI